MNPIEPCLLQFVKTPQGICPFCSIELVPYNNGIIHPRACPKGIKNSAPYCPYFMTLRSNHNVPSEIADSYNLLEISLYGTRVWIANWKAIKVIKIGEHQHISCVLLPVKYADFSDMEKFERRINTILIFQ